MNTAKFISLRKKLIKTNLYYKCLDTKIFIVNLPLSACSHMMQNTHSEPVWVNPKKPFCTYPAITLPCLALPILS